MKQITILLILCVLPFLVCSAPRFLQESQGECLESERQAQCTGENAVASCLCYNNGTCTSDIIDRCAACTNKEVKSVTQGCCSANITDTPSFQGVCKPQERTKPCVFYNPAPTCICWFNGTCESKWADRCRDCSLNELYSINPDNCTSAVLPYANDLCQPESRNVNCSVVSPVLSCVCYFNGTCQTKKTDRCSSCSNPDVLSVKKGCCPARRKSIVVAGANDCRNTPLAQCPRVINVLPNCPYNYTQGCMCYTNGTCVEDLVSSCILCQQPGVMSVEEGSKCPCPGVTKPCIETKINWCPDSKSGVAANCTSETSQGCVCYKNGTCVEKNMNPCQECSNNQDVTAAQTNTSCPCRGVQVLREPWEFY